MEFTQRSPEALDHNLHQPPSTRRRWLLHSRLLDGPVKEGAAVAQSDRDPAELLHQHRNVREVQAAQPPTAPSCSSMAFIPSQHQLTYLELGPLPDPSACSRKQNRDGDPAKLSSRRATNANKPQVYWELWPRPDPFLNAAQIPAGA